MFVKRTFVLVSLGVVAIVVLVAAIWIVRWALAWNDLPAFARPKGFHEIAHEYKCEGSGDQYCFHSWLYVSAARTYIEAIGDLDARYRAAGWAFYPCNITPDTCSSAMKGRYDDCVSYDDFKADSKLAENWRREFAEEIGSSASAILVTRGCV